MTILYVDSKANKAEVMDNITSQTIVSFYISEGSLKSIKSSQDAEGISFCNIPIGISYNNQHIVISVNNMDRIITIILNDILTREITNRIDIAFENIYIN